MFQKNAVNSQKYQCKRVWEVRENSINRNCNWMLKNTNILHQEVQLYRLTLEVKEHIALDSAPVQPKLFEEYLQQWYFLLYLQAVMKRTILKSTAVRKVILSTVLVLPMQKLKLTNKVLCKVTGYTSTLTILAKFTIYQ